MYNKVWPEKGRKPATRETERGRQLIVLAVLAFKVNACTFLLAFCGRLKTRAACKSQKGDKKSERRNAAEIRNKKKRYWKNFCVLDMQLQIMHKRWKMLQKDTNQKRKHLTQVSQRQELRARAVNVSWAALNRSLTHARVKAKTTQTSFKTFTKI